MSDPTYDITNGYRDPIAENQDLQEQLQEARRLLEELSIDRDSEESGFCPFCEMWLDAEIDEYQHQVYCVLKEVRAFLGESNGRQE